MSRRRWASPAAALLAGLGALNLADAAGVVGRGAVPDLARAGFAAVVLFGICGFGITRLFLPAGLRSREWLWVLPVGACVCALVMTVLGFAYVPFELNLALTLAGGAVLAVVAVRRVPGGVLGSGGVPALRRAGWPFYVALLLACVALIPLFRAGFATVGGEGQDAHLAVGSAIFLQHHYPTAEAIEEPVDRMPLVWRSKQPIYYALGATATLAGLDVFQTISTLAAVLLALSALGFYLFTREVLQAPRWVGLVAMGLVGLDRMVLHTIMHPYFNQTWGFFAMPFAFVLAWWVVKERTRGGVGLLVAFTAVLAFAYPLALPIPMIPILILLWPERRRVRPWLRGLWRGPRSLLWMVPVGFVALVPIRGVVEKGASAYNVVFNPTRTLRNWGGDLTGYFPEPWFLGMDEWWFFVAMIPVLGYGIWLAVRELPRGLRNGLLGVIAFAIVFGIWFRIREFGFYFHFKTLAFIAPIALVLAIAGLARARAAWVGPTAAVVLLLSAFGSANDELARTFDQLPKHVLALRSIDDALPPGRSIRLDVDPQEQNWVAFMLHGQPLCSQRPLLNTSYPHVPISRRADFILTKNDAPRPADAAGAPVRRLDAFTLWRARPGLPGPSRCSQKMVQTIERVTT